MRPALAVLLVMPRERRLDVIPKLEGCGAVVLPACNLREAIRLLEHQPVQVVLTDQVLPDGDWRAVLDCAAERQPGTQVVVAAATRAAALCAEAFQRGAFDVLAEPYTNEEVRCVLESAATKKYMAWLRERERDVEAPAG